MAREITFTAGELADFLGKSFTAGSTGISGAVSGLTPFNLLGQEGKPPKRRKKPRKADKAAEPYVAGLMVRAGDTGRVLLLQRAITEDDPAAGRWEPPGGHAEPGETLLQAALREFSEETGMNAPRGTLSGSWDASNGIYRGFILDVPSEGDVPIFDGRDQWNDPDDPHGDHVQAVAWFHPDEFASNPSMREEMQRDLSQVLAALSGEVAEKGAKGKTSAEVLREYWTHEGHPGPTRYALEQKIKWGQPDDWYRCVDELTPYIGAEGARGYCNLRHKEVLGYWPAQHAKMEREGKA